MDDDALLQAFGFDLPDTVEVRLVTRVDYRNTGNGYHRTTAHRLICAGCGREFDSNRRQLPGKRMWCIECKAAGKPAAQRARDFRARQ